MKSIKNLFLMLVIQGLFVQAGEESKIDDSFSFVENHNPLNKKRKFQEIEPHLSRPEFIQLQVHNYSKLDEGLALVHQHDETIPTLADFIEQNLEYDDEGGNFDESINENRLNFGEVVEQAEDILVVKMKVLFLEIIEQLIASHKNIHVIDMLHSQYVVNPVKICLYDFIAKYSLRDFNNIEALILLTQIEDFNNRQLDEKISIQAPIFEYVIKYKDEFIKPILKNLVNCKDSNNITLLQKTLQHNNIALVHILIDLGADITAKNEHGQTLLHEASSLNLVEIIDILISFNELARIEQSKYPIKNIKIMNVNDQDNQGQTALHAAVQSDAKNALILLLGRHVDESIVDSKGFHALALAIYSKKIAITEILLTTRFSQSLLRSKDDFCLVNAWNGIGKKYQDDINILLLADCCDKEHVELMQMLLDKGAGLNSADLILYGAIRHNLTDIVLLLLKQNVNVNMQENNENSMLYYAIKNNNEALVEGLIAKGANIHDRDIETGTTFLGVAVLHANQNIIKMLLNAGIHIDEVDDQGQTALHQAAQLNSTEIAKILVARGIDWNIVDNQGRTAEELAQTDEMKEFFLCIFFVNANSIASETRHFA